MLSISTPSWLQSNGNTHRRTVERRLASSTARRAKRLLLPEPQSSESYDLQTVRQHLYLVFKPEQSLVVTVDALTDVLDLWDSGDLEWHVDRGLADRFKGRNDLYVLTARFHSNDSKHEKAALSHALSYANGGYYQEVHEIGHKSNGYH